MSLYKGFYLSEKMHLFITPVTAQGSQLTIDEPRVVHQVSHVLRMRSGEVIAVQEGTQEQVTRRQIRLEQLTKTQLIGSVLASESVTRTGAQISLAVALPNKMEKLTMIVQKLTEVGIDKIIFRPSQRSQLRTLQQKTLERLEKIALEAGEQSERRFVPEISFVPHFVQTVDSSQQRCRFDRDGNPAASMPYAGGIIGPEGGFTDEEKAYFTSLAIDAIALGSTIMRTETAAIVGGWLLVQQ